MESEKLDEMVKLLRDKCMPSATIPHKYLNKENAEYLKLMLRDVVLNGGTGVSALISGPTNSGKTTLVESVISELSRDPLFKSSSHVIRLDGVLCPDFISALEELSYQLKAEEEFTDFMNTGNIAEGRTEVLEFLRGTLVSRTGAIIIILDNIELFCEHRGQALLYNLLDIARNEKKPICVIGVTACQEILELFEKRVKSRFGHRIIYVKPLTFDEYQNFSLQLVKLEKFDRWNQDMEKLLKANSVIQVLQQIHNTDNSIGTLCAFWYNLSLACDADTDLTPELIAKQYEETFQGYRNQQLQDLNLCEVLFLLSVLKLNKCGLPTFTFHKILETIRNSVEAKEVTDSDIRTAMQSLEAQHLITPVDKSCVYYRCEVDVQELNEVSKFHQLPAEFQELK